MSAFRDKLLTLHLSPAVRQPSARRNYYDRAALAQVIGEDAKERMLDATQGRGPAYRRGGEFYYQDRHTGEATRLSDAELASYVDGPEEGP